MNYSDETLRQIFTDTKVIACVGMSLKPERPSHYVSKFLMQRGFRVIPVSPGHAGKVMLNEVVRPSLRSIESEASVEMVDIFRRSEDVFPVVEEAIESLPHLKVIWMQLGIQNQSTATLAEAKGITVIQNRCPMIEYPRLFGG